MSTFVPYKIKCDLCKEYFINEGYGNQKYCDTCKQKFFGVKPKPKPKYKKRFIPLETPNYLLREMKFD